MNEYLELVQKISLAYNAKCKPICQKLKLPQTAFDILMFLANNPDCKTASDIIEIRKIKANLVSVNVDKLVNEGYLERKSIENDRRKTELICTDKALPIIEKGQKLQKSFFGQLFKGTDEEKQKIFFEAIKTMSENADIILKGDD